MAERLNILVSAMLAAVPNQGGWAWAVLQYLLGLERLGHRVFFVEPLTSATLGHADLDRSPAADYFRHTARDFSLSNAALWLADTRHTVGASYDELCAAAARADVWLNLSGVLAGGDLTHCIPVRVYLDLDPGFTQLWESVEGIDMRMAGHTHFVTVGLAIGRPGCPVPTCGQQWLTTLPPVVLERWPAGHPIVHHAFTTVANWRGYGSVEYQGVVYGQKVHSLRPLIGLPSKTSARLLLALAIHPQERGDLAALCHHGWQLVDPGQVAATPQQYAAFVCGSRGEFGLTKSGYVAARCAWFSDRTACYLAAGRPALVQDTGLEDFLPLGEGLLTFRTLDEAADGLERIQADYARHARAARHLAAEHLDSDKVLRRLLQAIGARG
jgi:hypothetical protein